MHSIVWLPMALMWPLTYFGWPELNALYVKLWNYLGAWGGAITIVTVYILLYYTHSRSNQYNDDDYNDSYSDWEDYGSYRYEYNTCK